MNEEKVIESMQTVISRILEDAAFIFTDLLEPEYRPDLETWEAEGVSLVFSGHDSGSVHMWVDGEFAKLAAANMRGIDIEDDGSTAMGMDTIREVLNIIVGNLLTEIYGSEPVFELGIPENLPKAMMMDDCRADDAVWFAAEGKPIVFILRKGRTVQ